MRSVAADLQIKTSGGSQGFHRVSRSSWNDNEWDDNTLPLGDPQNSEVQSFRNKRIQIQKKKKNSDSPPGSTARPRTENHPKNPAPRKVKVFTHTKSEHLFPYGDRVDSWIRVENGCVRPPSHQNSDHLDVDGRDKNKDDGQDRLKQSVLFGLCLITFHKRFNMTYGRVHTIKRQNVNRLK